MHASLLFAPLLALAQTQPSSTLTLEQALALAQRAPDADIVASQREEASSRKWSASGALLPKLRVEGGIQVWDRVSEVRFSNSAIDLSQLPAEVRPLFEGFNRPTRTREQITGNISLVALQPLTGLYPLWMARSVEVHGEAIAQQTTKKVMNDLYLRVVEAFVGALGAQQAAEVATKNLDFAKAFLLRTEQMVSAGMVGKSDLLKAKASLARAEDTELQARTSVEITRTTLASLLATPAVAAQTLVEPTVTAEAIPSMDDAMLVAKRERPELRELNERIAQGEAMVHVARSRLIPDVGLMANYTHTEGQSFQIRDQFYAGVTLGWDFFEWGNKWFLIDEAKAKVEGLLAQEKKLEQAMWLELKQAHIKALLAEQTKKVALTSKEAGAASLEDERTRYAAGASTATDLLLAQANSLQSDFSYIAAQTQALLARATLDRALGRAPLVR